MANISRLTGQIHNYWTRVLSSLYIQSTCDMRERKYGMSVLILNKIEVLCATRYRFSTGLIFLWKAIDCSYSAQSLCQIVNNPRFFYILLCLIWTTLARCTVYLSRSHTGLTYSREPSTYNNVAKTDVRCQFFSSSPWNPPSTYTEDTGT